MRSTDRTNPGDSSKSFKTEILLKADGQRIYSGLTADVEIETRRHQAVLKVPSQSVLSRPVDDLPLAIRDKNPDVDKDKAFATVVYRYVGGKAVVTPVIVGASDLTHSLIRSGINAGDRVIVGPYKALEALAHDQKVRDEREAATQPTSGPSPTTRPVPLAACLPVLRSQARAGKPPVAQQG